MSPVCPSPTLVKEDAGRSTIAPRVEIVQYVRVSLPTHSPGVMDKQTGRQNMIAQMYSDPLGSRALSCLKIMM